MSADCVCRSEGERTPILSVKNLSVTLGRRHVLHDVSLSVHRAEIVGLLGPNGGGKTTLLRTVLGFIRRDAGEIRIRARGRTGYLPQDLNIPGSYPVLTYDLVRLGLLRSTRSENRGHSMQDRHIREAMETVGLDLSLWHVPAGALSGGQKKLALLAMVFVGGSELLLLDEPAAALDDRAHARIVAALRRFCHDRGAAVVMATHDTGLMSHLDRAVHIDGTSIPAENPAPAGAVFGMRG